MKKKYRERAIDNKLTGITLVKIDICLHVISSSFFIIFTVNSL